MWLKRGGDDGQGGDLNLNLLIFYFHTKLDPDFEGCRKQYAQSHSIVKEDDDPAPEHGLEFATTRFLNTCAIRTRVEPAAESAAVMAFYPSLFNRV